MRLNHFRTVVVLMVLTLSNAHYAQSKDYTLRLGPYSKNKFEHSIELSREHQKKRFSPKTKKINVYNKYGKKFTLNSNDTVRVFDIYIGKWDGQSGQWIEFFDRDNIFSNGPTEPYYVYLNSMKDVENDALASDIIKKEKRRIAHNEKVWNEIKTIYIPTVMIILIIIIVIFYRRAYVTRCPKCRKRFARQLLKKEYLGQGSYTYSGSERVTVHVGNNVGYANVPVQKTKYYSIYRRYYKCKKCNHTWET